MERFRIEVPHSKVEPKNYIALNRKKACSKAKLDPTPQPTKPPVEDRKGSLLARRARQENTAQHSDVKRSLDQLASIISSGDLEKIIRLAKEIKGTPQAEEQPHHLATHTPPALPPAHVTQPIKLVEPSYVPGLAVDSSRTHTRVPISDVPVLTTRIEYDKPLNGTRQSSVSAEPFFGRGQGLKQLLELDNSGPSFPHQHVSRPSNEVRERGQRQEKEEVYYPWGRPGAGAPISTFKPQEISHHDSATDVIESQKSSQVNPYARHKISMIQNAGSTRPEEEKRRKANQYMLELQAQVKEKERMKREEQLRQDELDRVCNEKLARERDQMLLESERERERIKQKKLDANKHSQYMQSKIEEQHQLAIAERKKKKKFHHNNNNNNNNNSNDSVTPVAAQMINQTLIQKQVNLHKPSKQTEHNKSSRSPHKHGNIRNPPPSQLSVMQSSKQQQMRNTDDRKYSSMPTTRHSLEEDLGGNNDYMHVRLECFDQSADVSGSSSVVPSLKHVPLRDAHTDSLHPNSNAQLQQGEETTNVIKQLQRLKQGLYAKQEELHSAYT